MIRYRLTAIARRRPSLPLRMVLGKLYGKILDYGCGRGFDVNYLRSLGYDAYGYDPYWEQWNNPEILTPNTYDNVLCFYVLNVVLPKERHYILEEIKKVMKDDGHAYIAVRDTSEIVVGRPYYDGVLTIRGTFQKVFTSEELVDLVKQYFSSVNIISRKQPLLIEAQK